MAQTLNKNTDCRRPSETPTHGDWASATLQPACHARVVASEMGFYPQFIL